MSAITLIQHTELASQQASIELTSIPNTYDDLLIQYSLRVFRDGDFGFFYVQFNSDTTGANYASQYLRVRPTGAPFASSPSGGGNSIFGGSSTYNSATSQTQSSSEFYIPNYANSAEKALITESWSSNNSASTEAYLTVGNYYGTSAISSIKIIDGNGSNFIQKSTVTIFGITAGSSGGVTVS